MAVHRYLKSNQMQLKYEIDALLNIMIIINNHTGEIKRKNNTKINSTQDVSATPALLLDWSRMIILKPHWQFHIHKGTEYFWLKQTGI